MKAQTINTILAKNELTEKQLKVITYLNSALKDHLGKKYSDVAAKDIATAVGVSLTLPTVKVIVASLVRKGLLEEYTEQLSTGLEYKAIVFVNQEKMSYEPVKLPTVNTIIANNKLTENELTIINILNEELESHFGEVFSNLGVFDLASMSGETQATVKGILESLVKKGILATYNIDNNDEDLIYFADQENMEYEKLEMPTKKEKKTTKKKSSKTSPKKLEDKKEATEDNKEEPKEEKKEAATAKVKKVSLASLTRKVTRLANSINKDYTATVKVEKEGTSHVVLHVTDKYIKLDFKVRFLPNNLESTNTDEISTSIGWINAKAEFTTKFNEELPTTKGSSPETK